MLKASIENSTSVKFMKIIKRGNCFFRRYLSKNYRNSHLYSLYRSINGLIGKISFYAEFCFLRRITDVERKNISQVLDNTKFIKRLTYFYRAWKNKAKIYLGTAFLRSYAQELRQGLSSSPVRTFSIIVITAISVNILFSLVINKEIGVLGWITRSLFLSLGLSGLFCNANPEELKKTSLFLRLIFQARFL